MASVTLAEAAAQLGALVERAVQGETVEITRGGEPVAVIAPAAKPPAPKARKRINLEELRALTAGMPVQSEPAGEFIRRMRDEERY